MEDKAMNKDLFKLYTREFDFLVRKYNVDITCLINGNEVPINKTETYFESIKIIHNDIEYRVTPIDKIGRKTGCKYTCYELVQCGEIMDKIINDIDFRSLTSCVTLLCTRLSDDAVEELLKERGIVMT